MVPYAKVQAGLAALAVAAGLALSMPANAAPLAGLSQKAAAPAESVPSDIVRVHDDRYYRKKRSRYHRRYNRWHDDDYVDAPFTRYRRYSGDIDVDAPFASVRRRDHGVYVRAPFVDLYVPRWR